MKINEIKKLIREEVKKSFKRIITEQDGFQFYTIKGNQVPVIKIAVKGNAIYSVVANQDTEKFAVGEKIGGGTLADFQKSIGSGIYAEGEKYIKQKTQSPSNYFTERPSISNYGFIFDSNGKPALVGLEASSKKPVFTIAIPEGEGSMLAPNVIETPKGEKTIIPLEISLDNAFVVNKTTLNPEKAEKIKYFINALIRNKDNKIEKNYIVVASASADKKTSKESDMELSENRAKTIADYLNNMLNQYGYSFEYLSIGQTWYWNPKSAYAVEKAIEKGANEVEINKLYDQSAPNRKLMVLPKSTYKEKLPKGNYPLKK